MNADVVTRLLAVLCRHHPQSMTSKQLSTITRFTLRRTVQMLEAGAVPDLTKVVGGSVPRVGPNVRWRLDR